MAWKNDVIDRLDHLQRDLTTLKTFVVAQGRLLSSLAEKVERLSSNQSRAADKMADKLIEMAMVQQGANKSASIHRRSQVDMMEEGHSDPWQEKDNEWPPAGCDELRMP